MQELSRAVSVSALKIVREHLLTEAPDPIWLRNELAREVGLSSEDSQSLLYQVVKQLNLSLFPAVNQLELIHTEGCNLACSYCFEKNMLGYRRMSPEVAAAAIDLLFAYSGNETDLEITHFGGEPTLNMTGIKLSTEYAKRKANELSKNLRFDMTSNGVLFTEEMVNYFAEQGIQVLLSIDGLESSHNRYRVDKQGKGTFERAIHGMNILKAVQPWVGVKMTIMPENAAHLFADVVGLYALGANQILIGHATGIPWPAEAMTAYEQQFGRLYAWYLEMPRNDLKIDAFEELKNEAYFGCQAGRTSIAVTVNGEISPCSKIMGFSSNELVGKLGDIHYGLTHLKTRFQLVSCSKVKVACAEQEIADDYRGGCFAVNYGENGDLFQPSLQEHSFTLLRRSACAGCASNK